VVVVVGVREEGVGGVRSEGGGLGVVSVIVADGGVGVVVVIREERVEGWGGVGHWK
jgi:hypothetical protein